VIDDGMPCDPIKGQGHIKVKVMGLGKFMSFVDYSGVWQITGDS